jgi:hypothetical protein
MSPETIILMMANGNMANMSIWIIMYFAIKMLLENYPKIKKLSYLLMRKKTNEYMNTYKFTNRVSAKSENEICMPDKNILAISYYIKNNIKTIKQLQIIALEGQREVLYYPSNGEKIDLTDIISVICDYNSSENEKKDTSVETIRVELYSKKNREDIENFMKSAIGVYEENRACSDNDNIIQITTDFSGLNDTEVPFKTEKTFDNLFFRQKDELIQRLKSFQNSDIYSKLGIQRSLGLLFSGEPGTGKTSTIKAIAKKLGYHIIPIQMNKFMSKKRLQRIFQTLNMGTCANDIQFNKRLYLFEEIDCNDWADIVKARKISDTATESTLTSYDNISMPAVVGNTVKDAKNDDILTEGSNDSDDSDEFNAFKRKHTKISNKKARELENDKVTLGTLLELMDGLVEFPGRIIIMTTNHPEILDPALLRPGRIDMHIHFTKLRGVDIAHIYKLWTGFSLSNEDIMRIPNDTYTQAQISQLIFKYEFEPHKFMECMFSIVEKKEN